MAAAAAAAAADVTEEDARGLPWSAIDKIWRENSWEKELESSERKWRYMQRA